VPTQRWVIPEAEYARIRPARPKAAAAQPENARPGPALQITANGPASSLRGAISSLDVPGSGARLVNAVW
jgi:hypothetical protein